LRVTCKFISKLIQKYVYILHRTKPIVAFKYNGFRSFLCKEKKDKVLVSMSSANQKELLKEKTVYTFINLKIAVKSFQVRKGFSSLQFLNDLVNFKGKF